MSHKFKTTVIVTVLLGVAPAGCLNRGDAVNDENHPSDHEHEHQRSEGKEKADEHAGHPHDENEVSDLDRSVDELFAATCEHSIKTHACDECRYEVGVVKVVASLFEGGLLKTVKAEKKAVAVSLGLTGEIQFDDRRVAHVSTLAEGIIRRVHVTLGDKIRRGQALLELESVSVGEAQAAYLEARGMRELAQRNYDRVALLREEGIASEKELLASKRELEVGQIRTDAALGKLTRLGMTSSVARALTLAGTQGRLVIYAPAAGTILAMHAVAGEVVRPGTVLLTVGDNSSLWVWADLYERDIARVTHEQGKQPLAAKVEVKAFPGEQFEGTVDFVSPAMSESSRTVKLRIAVPNPKGRLLAGMFARVKVFVSGSKKAFTVPQGAVLEDGGRTFVFAHHDGDYYVRRPVSIGSTFAGLVEVTSGLNGDEILVSDGAFLMKSDVLRSKMGAGCAD